MSRSRNWYAHIRYDISDILALQYIYHLTRNTFRDMINNKQKVGGIPYVHE